MYGDVVRSLGPDTLHALLVGMVHTCFFFFQAEDGIRDWSVTGVQTCALPISSLRTGRWIRRRRVTLISKLSLRRKINLLDQSNNGRATMNRCSDAGLRSSAYAAAASQ